jgi:hypothetical protein
MRVTQEPDRLHVRAVTLTALAGTAFMALGVVIAWNVRGITERSAAPAAEPIATRWGEPPADLNAIEMGMFAPASKAVPSPAPPSSLVPERLREFGWSDKPHGIVFIPIEQAKLLYLAGKRAPAPRPSDPTSRPTTAEEPR